MGRTPADHQELEKNQGQLPFLGEQKHVESLVFREIWGGKTKKQAKS